MKPNLYEYLDLSQYLRDLYKYRKLKEKDFSYDVWVQEIGLKSRGHLRSIVIGEVKLTENLIEDFIQGMQLDPDSAEYFTLLTKYSTASTPKLKEVYGKSLISLWKVKIHQVEIKDLAEFLSDAVIPVVFTYLSFEDSSSDVSEIALNLGYDVSRIQNALKCLVWQKLIDGHISDSGHVKYKTIQSYFNIPSTPNNLHIRNFHIDGLRLAEKAHDFPYEQRKFYSSFVALSHDQFMQAQKIIQDCNKKILSLFENSQLNNRQIFRLNVQIFPVSGTECFAQNEKLNTPASTS